MNRPLHIPVTAEPSPQRQGLIIALVVALHLALVYAIVSGLAMRVVLSAPSILSAEILPTEQPVHQPPPATPELVRPALPAVPQPVIRITSGATRSSITVVQAPPGPVVAAPVAPVPAPKAIAPTPARALAGTHTIPPYPELARRLGEQGTVELRISLDVTGAVSAVIVQRSSGSDRLDAAAVAWVRAHWRYRPATEGGKPVASSVLADVVFDLRSAR